MTVFIAKNDGEMAAGSAVTVAGGITVVGADIGEDVGDDSAACVSARRGSRVALLAIVGARPRAFVALGAEVGAGVAHAASIHINSNKTRIRIFYFLLTPSPKSA